SCAQKPREAVGLRRPRLPRLAIDVPEPRRRRGDVDLAEHDREREATRAYRAWVENTETPISTNERNVRMPAHHDRDLFSACEARDFCAELGAINRNVHEQDAKLEGRAVDQIECSYFGDVAGVYVDVAAHGEHGRDRAESVQHLEVTDVTRVQDGVGAELEQ